MKVLMILKTVQSTIGLINKFPNKVLQTKQNIDLFF